MSSLDDLVQLVFLVDAMAASSIGSIISFLVMTTHPISLSWTLDKPLPCCNLTSHPI